MAFPFLRIAQDVESREVKMVCIVCNGKGYIIEKDKEVACPECQGRGEDFVDEGGKALHARASRIR